MARPRRVSDDEVLDATGRVVARRGPLRFTLAEVAREVGVTAPALVQRFDSKRALLEALVRRDVERVLPRFARARASTATPLDALLLALQAGPDAMRTRAEAASAVAFLELDLTDDGFHSLAVEYFERFERCVRALLIEAVARRELRKCDVPALARAVEVAYNGSLIRWAIRGGEDGGDAMRRDVEAALAPWRRVRSSASGARARPRGASARRGGAS